MSSWNATQWAVIDALADAYIAPLSANEIDAANPQTSAGAHAAVANVPASQQPGFHGVIETAATYINPAKIRVLGLVLHVLSYRVSAVALTGSPKLLTEMSIEERTSVIKYWQRSPLPQLKMLAAQMCDLAMFGYLYGNPAVLESAGYELHNPIFEKLATGALFIPRMVNSVDRKFDVVIIGSGCGGGVVASIAARAGLSVLVVEKAPYVHPNDVSGHPSLMEQQAFELSGRLMSDDASMAILAGSTVGGGGAVNWSCSLKTPQPVREQWAAEVPWYATNEYDEAMDYVFDEMKVTKEFGAPHSFTNQLILDASEKLDYPAGVAAQNTGEHAPNNKFQGWGYRSGEKGGISVWLEKACAAGAVVMPGALAKHITRRGGRATGVELEVNGARVHVEAQRVVCAGGSLHTPGLLLRSGFRNKHVGRHLKLHPVTLVYGDFDEVVNRPDDPIMTTVCSHFSNLDGKFHGPRIEAVHTIPHLIGKFLPWKDGKDNAQNLLRYSHLAALLVITRDAGEGQVYLDKAVPHTPSVAYTTSKFDLWALHEGAVVAANMVYMGGARRIIMPDAALPYFESARPKEARRINDSDYQHWLAKVKAHTFRNYDIACGSAHQMGSCRMSARGARHGAVDAAGRLYECRNVHVIDASVFPSASGVNPMITTLSTAKVLADRLVQSFDQPRL